MTLIRILSALALLGAMAAPVFADDISEAIDQAHKAYQSGDLTGAKQSLDLASQLIGQKSAERFATLLTNPLPGWTADKAQTATVVLGLGSEASRTYT